MPRLVLTRKTYDASLVQVWVKRRRGVLGPDGAVDPLLELLKKKARGRTKGTRRFFGEAYVVSRIRHREGYYGSFKWLTSPLFLGDKKFQKGPKEDLREALHRHFGPDQLARLQDAALRFYRTHRKDLDGKKPAAPDLWLVDGKGRHRFIEVKLPGDSVGPHQLAGLAAIAACLRPSKALSVEVIELHPEEKLMFRTFSRAMRMSRRKGR